MDGMSDMREASVKLLAERFSVDATQAANVRSTSIYLFDALASDLDLDKSEISTLKKMLTWAAQCHEIGCAISHTESHRHGAYILDNAELMGFSQSELHQLSLLVLGNHGKIKKLDLLTKDVGFIVILACLRLAVILCHSRNKPELRDIGLHLNENSIQLNVTQNWLRKFPQSAYLLEEEVISWQKTNWGFMIAISKDL